jgi:hypothetical protein
MAPLIAYLIFAAVVFSLCCWASKLDGEDVTIGYALLFVFLSLVPGLNVLVMCVALIVITDQTKFFSKKLF